ncbi:MAG: hypothetical protein H8D23_10915 [Candidatus Brocadiales bacterium]|nr:hypothetical protein [Candidatus Brocadiales bacterium]
MKITDKLKGAKVNIATRNGIESYIGLISQITEDGWIELVPFAPEPVQAKFKDLAPDMAIVPIPTTMYKLMSTIETVIILEKPDPEFYGNKDNSEDSEN